MGLLTEISPVYETASLIGWWRDAGVDTLIDETPRNWLAQPTVAPRANPGHPLAEESRTAPVATLLPDTLDAFRSWFLANASVPEGGPPNRRVAPAGNPASGLMLLADVPETGDVEAGTLLSGEAGALLDRMLAALGKDRSSVYIATMAPSRPATGRLSTEAIDRLTPAARRHVSLVAPKQLWLMGRAASRALLGMDEAEAAGKLHRINLESGMMSAIATVHPRVLLDEAKGGGRRMRKSVWADMQLLINGQDA